jgi:hypothetical protein
VGACAPAPPTDTPAEPEHSPLFQPTSRPIGGLAAALREPSTHYSDQAHIGRCYVVLSSRQSTDDRPTDDLRTAGSRPQGDTV